MASMASKVYRAFDAEAAVTLRDITDGAETGADTDAEAGVSLNKLTNAYWDNDEIPHGVISFAIEISNILVDGDASEYAIVFQIDDAGSFSAPVEVARLAQPLATGFYEVLVHSKTIKALADANGVEPTMIRCAAVKNHSTSTITYGVWATHRGA